MSFEPVMRETLRRSFPGWPKPVIESRWSVSRIRQMAKGNLPARLGSPSKEIIVVLLGGVRVIGESPDGREFTFANLEPGHWIGLVPLTDEQGMMADHPCHEDSTFALLPADKGLELSGWQGVAVRVGTPPVIVDRLRKQLVRISALPEFKQRFENAGDKLVGGTSAEFAELVRNDTAQQTQLIRQLNIKLQ